GELDVPQAARAALGLPVALGPGYRLDDALAHGADVGYRLGPLGGMPDERLQGVQPLASQFEIAGRRPGLQQRLELPGARPLLVVREMAGERADQRAAAAFGTQRGVDRPGDL